MGGSMLLTGYTDKLMEQISHFVVFFGALLKLIGIALDIGKFFSREISSFGGVCSICGLCGSGFGSFGRYLGGLCGSLCGSCLTGLRDRSFFSLYSGFGCGRWGYFCS